MAIDGHPTGNRWAGCWRKMVKMSEISDFLKIGQKASYCPLLPKKAQKGDLRKNRLRFESPCKVMLQRKLRKMAIFILWYSGLSLTL